MNNLTIIITTIIIFLRFPATACPCKRHIQRIPSARGASSWSGACEGFHDEAYGAGRRHEGVLGLLFASGIVRHSVHVCQVPLRSVSSSWQHQPRTAKEERRGKDTSLTHMQISTIAVAFY